MIEWTWIEWNWRCTVLLIACFAVGACAAPGGRPSEDRIQGASPPSVDWSRVGPAKSYPRDDDLGPALRGNSGGA